MSETKVNDIKKVIDSLIEMIHSVDGQGTKAVMILQCIKNYDRLVILARHGEQISAEEETCLDEYMSSALFCVLHYHFGSNHWWEG